MAGVTTESNSMQKTNVGGQPDPLMSALNALLTQMGGTNYDRNPGAMSYGPDKTLPNSMQIRSPGGPQPAPIPLPEANPNFHAQSPLEMDLGALFRQTMMPDQPPVMPVPPEAMAMGMQEAPPAPPAAKPLPKKPQRAQQKGNPSTEPKQVTPPPKKPGKKRMIAGK